LTRNRFIDPAAELGGKLLTVDKPARYTGGEYGIKADKDAPFKTLIAFPDLYEIGMGNQALKIIYNRMNGMQDVSCDRAFAPAPDFEKLLRENNIPLYGLDTGIALYCLDMLMFTVGYELGLGGILLMLDASFIPLRREERTDEHPIVIAGGPAVSNPAAFSPFIDAFWMGEAEAGFFELAFDLAKMKEGGKGRGELLEKISAHPNIYVKGKEKTLRAIHADFCNGGGADAAVFPVPSMKIVQHHGSVEIMRGCPNGCRFCHAGYWYRPMRQKSSSLIGTQVGEMVAKGGWREISLSSLSSGDYKGIDGLVETLNGMFAGQRVSFQLPSLKVSSFSLSLLEKISVTRKSGLTFAVETPQEAWQMSVNKEVTLDSVTSILNEAKKRGWKTAKFYFMIGLPLPESVKSEEEEIVNFIASAGRRTRMRFNINVGLFVPKPHTPYQMSPQLDAAEAGKKMDYIRDRLKPLGHKVGVSDTLMPQIEGMLSRGDERAGLIYEQAYLGGSRLDAWNEYIDRGIWLSLFEENKDLTGSFLNGKNEMPWREIDSCVSAEYIRSEKEKSDNSQFTPSCKEKCSLCGVCGKEIKIVENSDISPLTAESTVNPDSDVNHQNNTVNKNKMDPDIYRLLFSFSKSGGAVFHGHLSLIELFSMAFTRAGIPVIYTKGFNPIPKMEFASPLSTGISADSEIAAVDFSEPFAPERFVTDMNLKLPQGFRIENAVCYYIPSGMKKHSLSSLLWGFGYKNKDATDYVRAKEEKAYRQERLKECESQFYLRRNLVLARNVTGNEDEWSPYFDAYNTLYNSRQNTHYD
jgi:radical SAM-linked protein